MKKIPSIAILATIPFLAGCNLLEGNPVKKMNKPKTQSYSQKVDAETFDEKETTTARNFLNALFEYEEGDPKKLIKGYTLQMDSYTEVNAKLTTNKIKGQCTTQTRMNGKMVFDYLNKVQNTTSKQDSYLKAENFLADQNPEYDLATGTYYYDDKVDFSSSTYKATTTSKEEEAVQYDLENKKEYDFDILAGTYEEKNLSEIFDYDQNQLFATAITFAFILATPNDDTGKKIYQRYVDDDVLTVVLNISNASYTDEESKITSVSNYDYLMQVDYKNGKAIKIEERNITSTATDYKLEYSEKNYSVIQFEIADPNLKLYNVDDFTKA